MILLTNHKTGGLTLTIRKPNTQSIIQAIEWPATVIDRSVLNCVVFSINPKRFLRILKFAGRQNGYGEFSMPLGTITSFGKSKVKCITKRYTYI